MRRLHDTVASVEGFTKLPHADKLRLFAWVLHGDGKESFRAADFAHCYDILHVQPPGNLHRAVQALQEQGDFLKTANGLKLSRSERDLHDTKYGSRPITTQLHALFAALPGELTSPAQREYLAEAVVCAKHGAWRAAVIMSWNVAYDHVCQVIMARLVDFNAALLKVFPKRTVIASRGDLRELNESEVIKVARTADLVDKTQHKCLERSLGIRNDAAHPSGATFNQPKTEAFALDVIQTIVLGLPIAPSAVMNEP